LKESEEEAINDVMKFTSFLGYKDVIIEEIKAINIDDLDEIEELIEDVILMALFKILKKHIQMKSRMLQITH
jgi:formate-dependent phosphoribosylglycinamide formyltransferase (GAR transformylase)